MIEYNKVESLKPILIRDLVIYPTYYPITSRYWLFILPITQLHHVTTVSLR